jgi:two-component system chemotaxis sensor kinase CheA
MDVVKRNIVALRGSVGIDSRPGQGTTVTVRLPLTLAIINGFQVAVGKSVFVVPLDMVDECVEFSAQPGHDYTDLRGQVLPFIRLRGHFDLPGEPAARENIVVVKHANQKFGLVVDSLLGEAQTVIKPLSKLFGQVRGISGSSGIFASSALPCAQNASKSGGSVCVGRRSSGEKPAVARPR